MQFVGSEAVAAEQPLHPAAVLADSVSRQGPEEQGGGANMTELLISGAFGRQKNQWPARRVKSLRIQ